jgi:hypothetical protein
VENADLSDLFDWAEHCKTYLAGEKEQEEPLIFFN